MKEPGSTAERRRIRPDAYLLLLLGFASILFLLHAPYARLPYFWDEMGQFVPAALDIANSGAWVPRSTVPNVHPPAVMAYLALVWKTAGYSIAATRVAMLALASLGALFAFLLAIELCRPLRGAPAFAAVLLLIASPLFYTQAMMAQLDMPAMVFTLAALLLFLQRRYAVCAAVCTLLVLVKETGLVAPALFLVWLVFREKRLREACYFVAPFAALAIWLVILKRATGYWLGDAGFTHYNVFYSLEPVRVIAALVRRIYYLFFAEFRWIGTIAIVLAWRGGVRPDRSQGTTTPLRSWLGKGLSWAGNVWRGRIGNESSVFNTREWAITGLFCAAHVLLVSLFGGATLERYLLPVLPIVYIAAAAAWTLYTPGWRLTSALGLAAGLVASLFWNSPYPVPLENNLAMVDFVHVQQAAAQFLDAHMPGATVASAWPFTQALADPRFGYVHRPFHTVETTDFRRSNVMAVNPSKVDALAVYARTWTPSWSVLRSRVVTEFLHRYYDYEPQIPGKEIELWLGFQPAARWERRGQWIELYVKPSAERVHFQHRPGGISSPEGSASWNRSRESKPDLRASGRVAVLAARGEFPANGRR